ncbi:signal recognition particle-docking protein FtsY [Haladaptatus sp. F3-133]|uniref:Signal recognition particle receptor FtsY n=1 Tax=Halorutilus salinus TaxID=2487751 RepID=A0A9Q4C4B0_9EURY|nr:signal recognition particle-docking protein FtsY [Halorutilus salinus]MCX2818071.1 signal recognition particle-docking protein FtsY [Halorutilus salinus]
MFDGLKDRLNDFREEADEAVEEVGEDQETEEPRERSDGTRQEPEEQDGDAEIEEGDGEDDGEGDEEEEGGLRAKAKTLVGERAFIIEEDDLEAPLQDLEMALLASDVEVDVADEVVEGVRESLVGEKKHWRDSKNELIDDALREALVDVVDVDGLDFDSYVRDTDKPVVVVFTGVNGVGKTTTIAKVAKRLEDDGFSSVLANGDTYRAGANQQLSEHADALGKKVITHEQGGDPAAVIYDAVEYAEANGVDVVLGDTAGRLHTSDDLMNQLAKIDRVVDPDLTVFVDESVAGQDATNRAREFNDAAEFDGVVLTKADADSAGGAAVSVARVTGKPIVFLGTGQGYDDLREFDAEGFVDELLEQRE